MSQENSSVCVEDVYMVTNPPPPPFFLYVMCAEHAGFVSLRNQHVQPGQDMYPAAQLCVTSLYLDTD